VGGGHRQGAGPLHDLRDVHGGVVVRSPDGKTIATGCEDGTIKLWDLPPSGKVLVLSAAEPQKTAPGKPAVSGEVREATLDLIGALAVRRAGKIRMVENAQLVYVTRYFDHEPLVTTVKEFPEKRAQPFLGGADQVAVEFTVEPTGPGLAVAKVNLKSAGLVKQVVVVFHVSRGECLLYSIAVTE
jgi:hypothetical protein